MIKTARLTLRHFRAEDSVALHPIFADPEAMRFWSTPPHDTFAETEAFVQRTIAATREGSGEDFVVVYENEVVGKAGLWNNADIGFIFAPRVWGMGLASEAVRAIMDHAARKGVSRIVADVDPRNAPCIRLLKKCGFVQTGSATRTMRVGDVWVDSAYFEAAQN